MWVIRTSRDDRVATGQATHKMAICRVIKIYRVTRTNRAIRVTRDIRVNNVVCLLGLGY